MKKRLAVVLCAAMMLSACGGASGSDQAADTKGQAEADSKADDTEGSKGDGKLVLSTYGLSEDISEDEVYTPFEQEFGCEIVTETGGTNDRYTKLAADSESTIDVIELSQAMTAKGADEGLFDTIDLSKIPNAENLIPAAKELAENGQGIPYTINSIGIIYNPELTGFEIKSFDDLKKVAEDITARKDELGFAAFTSAGMDGSSDWRFKTHLANLPIYFEYQADGINSTDAIKGTYLDNYKAIFDLYINNSTCAPADLSGKTGTDSENEFLNGKAVFFQNGSWEYSALSAKYSDDEMTMIPIYIGVGDEANQGLCTGTENYWCVNKDAAPEDIQATLDFMYWCVTSDKGTQAMANDMGFVIPFKKAAESPNLFVKVDKELTAAGKTPVSWNFTTMPSEQWKNDVGSALTAYAAGTGDWEAVKTAFVDGWAKEAALNG